MREIKFRTWDKSDSLMYQNVQNGIKFDDGSEYPFSRFLGAQENGDYHKWEIMQFTNLTTVDGTPIYEGDILSSDEKTKHTVIYSNGSFVLQHNFCRNNLSCPKYVYDVQDTDKIIGNIYENPELLT